MVRIYAVCSYVWCNVNFSYTMFICIAMNSSEVMSHLKLVPGNLDSKASCALITFLYPIMFKLITVTCLG
jgi:hypothetical protein